MYPDNVEKAWSTFHWPARLHGILGTHDSIRPRYQFFHLTVRRYCPRLVGLRLLPLCTRPRRRRRRPASSTVVAISAASPTRPLPHLTFPPAQASASVQAFPVPRSPVAWFSA